MQLMHICILLGDPHSITHHHESGQAEAGVDQTPQEGEVGRAATWTRSRIGSRELSRQSGGQSATRAYM